MPAKTIEPPPVTICLSFSDIKLLDLALNNPLEYHLRELEVARDATATNNVMPVFEEHHKVILDIGCGMGQTLIASNLPEDVMAYGVDVEEEAITAGKQICPPNISLSTGSGEHLNFQNETFDIVVCRVALPYMNVRQTLSEIYRVLKPGGETWLVLHPWEMFTARAARSFKARRYKDSLYCGFVLANGVLQHLSGIQLRIRNRTETFQTVRSIRADLGRAHFADIRVTSHPFIAEARK